MQFLIVSGLSGSGKSSAMHVLEDIGFYCIDNMPPQLIGKFAEICSQSEGKIDKVAIAVDIRGGDLFKNIADDLEALSNQGLNYKVLFIEANDDVLIKRYRETRRKHPLDEESHGSLDRAISAEREMLHPLREMANYYVDTSFLSTAQLKESVKNLFLDDASDSMIVKVISFGFKYGATTEADLVFDVRCLPNPFYVPELKNLTGCDSVVRDYVMGFSQAGELLKKLKDLADFLIPLYIKEGKSQLVIGFGCTGGKHRSVTFANIFAEYLKDKGMRVRISHRDINKDR